MAIPVFITGERKGEGKKGLKGAGDEINCWNFHSLGARKDVLVSEKEEKTSRVAPKHFTFLKFTYFL